MKNLKETNHVYTFENLIPFFKVVNFRLDQTRSYGSFIKLMVPRSAKNNTLLTIIRKHRKSNGMYLTTGRNQTMQQNGVMVPVPNTYQIAVNNLLEDLNNQGLTSFEYDEFMRSIIIKDI